MGSMVFHYELRGVLATLARVLGGAGDAEALDGELYRACAARGDLAFSAFCAACCKKVVGSLVYVSDGAAVSMDTAGVFHREPSDAPDGPSLRGEGLEYFRAACFELMNVPHPHRTVGMRVRRYRTLLAWGSKYIVVSQSTSP